MDVRISLFENTFTKNAPADVSLLKVLEAIKSLKWKDKVDRLMLDKENKKFLPCVTFSGTFTSRKAQHIKQYSGFIVIDIDHMDSLDNLKQSLREDPITYAFFVSPSRKGLKVLVKVGNDKNMHQDMFLSLERHFIDNHGVVIDKSGKDVCRLCYVSYDEDLHLNESSEIYTYKPIPAKETRINETFKFKPINGREQIVCTDTNFMYIQAVKWNNNKFVYIDGSRNVYIHALACILNKMGIAREEAVHLIYSNCPSPPLLEPEIRQAVISAYNNRGEHGATQLYINAPLPPPVVVEKKSSSKKLLSAAKNEDKLQNGACAHMRRNYPGVIFASESSGLNASIGVAMKLKAQRSKGKLPDLMIFKANGGYYGLVLELKKEGSSPYLKDGIIMRDSEHVREQFKTLELLSKEGYLAKFATGWVEIKKAIDDYMALPPTKII